MSSIWTITPTIESMTDNSVATAVDHMGIEFTDVGDDYISARMPVDERTVQPHRILHGGASVVLAETLGSVAANHCLRKEGTAAVGLEINANHIRKVTSGRVSAVAKAVHVGRTTNVWDIRISDEDDKTVCVSRLTMAIIDMP